MNAIADGPAFFYFFPARCIHLCPGEHSLIPSPTDLHFFYFFPARCIHLCPSEHSRMPSPMDLHFFISFRTGASIHVPVSIPECYRQRTCIFLFLSSQMHPSMSQ